VKIVFWGTPEIAVPSLQFFIDKNDIEVVAVITQPDKPAGRGHKIISSPVKLLAESLGITVYQPKLVRKDHDLINILKQLAPDAFITVAFGQILSQEILDIPRLGTINLHASLLPKYRGPNPIQWAVINGENITGVTTMLSDAGIDTGPMLFKKEIPLDETIDSLELSEKIALTGPQLLYDSLSGLNNRTITPIPQNDSEASNAPKLQKENGNINWDESAKNIHNKIRGMKPWPSTYTHFKGNTVKITQSSLYNNEKLNNKTPGEIIGIVDNGIEVATGDGNIIINLLQPAGKKQIDAKSWYNGARIQPGDNFSS